MTAKVTSSGNVLRSVPQPARFASPEDVRLDEPEPLPDLSHLLPWHRVVIEEILTKYPHMIEKVREATR